MSAPQQSVEIKFMTKGVEYVAHVSPEDEERVRALKWGFWGGYAHSPNVGTMHATVMGDRPADVPEDYVIDHRDRVKLNNTRENLRWVPESFNIWNYERPRSGTYRGVSWNNGGWLVIFRKVNCGKYADEHAAGRAYVKACIIAFGELASTSDILVGDGPGKFSVAEIEEIEAEIANDDFYVKKTRSLPPGVYESYGKYVAKHARTLLGRYDTVQEAQDVRDKYVKELEDKEYAEHLKQGITRDDDGDAVIALSGDKGDGQFTKVPEKFWHELTFNTAWNLSFYGYATGRRGLLHAVIWKLLNPGYTPKKGFSIDHIDAAAKLDNREENLRLETINGQARNKVKRPGGTSKYVGVLFDVRTGKWIGYFSHEGKTRRFISDTEDGAYERMQAAKKALGFAV